MSNFTAGDTSSTYLVRYEMSVTLTPNRGETFGDGVWTTLRAEDRHNLYTVAADFAIRLLALLRRTDARRRSRGKGNNADHPGRTSEIMYDQT